MANNRLYIVCNQCGEHIMIAKDFLNGFDLRVSADDIEKFLQEHAYCGEESGPGDFSIGYEFTDYCSGPCVEV